MASGIAIHIGLNAVNPEHYSGWEGILNACEFDANDMELISTSQGFSATKLLTRQATRQAVTDAIADAGRRLSGEDILLITYSGHGGQVPDISGDEPDFKDETWCLYDGQLIDDELRALWIHMPLGLRVLVISDSCHSGSVTKAASARFMAYSDEVPRYMPDEMMVNTYMANKNFYDNLARQPVTFDIGANIRLISGCQDNQYSYDGQFNGAFTGALKRVWAGGQFQGNYERFHKQIQALMPAYQSPNHFVYGRPNEEYAMQRPFTIDASPDACAPTITSINLKR